VPPTRAVGYHQAARRGGISTYRGPREAATGGRHNVVPVSLHMARAGKMSEAHVEAHSAWHATSRQHYEVWLRKKINPFEVLVGDKLIEALVRLLYQLVAVNTCDEKDMQPVLLLMINPTMQ
jgi:hypothetical protein